MTGNNPHKFPLLATLLTALGLVVLCGLGTWQLQRLAWKQNVLSKLNAAYEGKNAASLLEQKFTTGDFLYGRAAGTFKPDKAILLGPKTRDGNIGADLIAPLITPQGTIFVNMGWSAYGLGKQPIYHLQNQTVWFEGLARAPSWNSFTPENQPKENIWYKPDLEEIAAVKDLPPPLPFMVYAEHASHKFDAAFPNNERWQPNNNHAQYTMFWYSLAGVFLVIYVLRFWIRREKTA